MKKIKGIFAVAFTVICALCLSVFTSSAADEGKWITAWSTAATEIGLEGYGNISAMVQNVAVRTVVTPTASGTKIRVKFSNAYGKKDLIIDRANIAVSDTSESASGINVSTRKYISFEGSPGVTIPAGKEIYSDAVPFDVVAGQDIAVSTFIREFTEVRTMGLSGGSTYLKAALEGSGTDLIESKNFNIIYDIELDAETQWLYGFMDKFFGSVLGTGTLDNPISAGRIEVVPIITDIDVLNPNSNAYTVAVIGDSTVANNYPLYLSEEILKMNISDIGVASKGLVGNRLLGGGLGYGSLIYGESLIDRMKKDIIGLDGKNPANVKYIILKTGANDIIHPVCSNIKGEKQPTANEIKEGFKRVFDFCHKNGIKVIVSSITPWGAYKGTDVSAGPQYERTAAERQKDWQIAVEVNNWLKSTTLHDGYVDYNSISKNSLDASAMKPEYTTDGLLPSDTLQRRWAEKFPYALIGAEENPRAAGVGISYEKLTVYKGSTKTLTAKVTPAAANQKVTWHSSNTSVATVNANGIITPKAKGVTTITVKTVDNGYSGTGYTATCKVTVKVKPSSIKISGAEKTIFTTKKTQLKAKVYPSDTDFKKVKWSSSNEKVATVNSKGVVTATGKGKAVITATSTFSSKIKATYTVTVKKKIQVQSVYLNYDERSRYVGTSFTLVPNIYPSNASFPEVIWKSSNTKVARVDENGKVTARKAGMAVITCKSVDNPGVNATCIVTVKVKTMDVEIPTRKLTLYTSQSKTLKAEVSPSNATNKKVTWSSSNKSVATVSKSGKITALKPGTAVITVKTNNGGYKDTCKVTVKKYISLKSFKLNKTSVSIANGKTYALVPVFSPSNASNKDLVWKSSNTKVATVSSKGVVKGIKPGTATISCRSEETGKTVTCAVKVKAVKVKKLIFAEEVYTVKHNRTLQLKVLVSPTNATNKQVKWKSSHPEFVKVSSTGKVKGLKVGKDAIITATSVDGEKIAVCRVKVQRVDVRGIRLNKSIASAFTGGTVTLTPTLIPSKPTNSKITWSSSDTKLATVSDKGVVKALREGTVVITCKTADGGYTASCTVVIEKGVRVTKVTLDKTEEEADVNTAFNLIATIEPYNASNKRLIWSSTNTAVATVSANGRVLTLKPGLTYIRVTTEDGRKVASCRLTVV